MNILQVLPYDVDRPGGVRTHILELSRELSGRGHKVAVLAPGSKAGVDKHIAVHRITQPRRFPLWGTQIDATYLSLRQRRALRQLLTEFRPDLVHFHTPWNPVMQTQMLSMLPGHITRVATFHDTPPDRGLGRWIGAPLMRWAAPHYLSRLDAAISVSDVQRRAMGLPEDSLNSHITLIPNGIRWNPETSPRAGSRKTGARILFIGRLEPRKGVGELIELIQRAATHPALSSVEWDIVGDGPHRGSVQALVHRGQGRVRFHPGADDDQKSTLLDACDLLVAPSLYGESFGIVLLEAMAHGAVPVGFGNAGYLTLAGRYAPENFPPPGDVEALLTRIVHLVASQPNRERLRNKGFDLAREYAWDRVAEQVERVYQAALRERDPATVRIQSGKEA